MEDAFDQALLVKTFLQDPYHVVHSQDGDRAARLLEEEQWDLLVTDLNLPGMDGFTLIQKARSLHPELPILAVTGYTAAHYHEQAFRAGADDLLTKPLDRDPFLKRVQDLTAGGDAVPRAASPGETVLAVGGLVGDVEMGCGASILRLRAEEEREAVILPLCKDEMDTTGSGIKAARAAADILGGRLVLDLNAMEETERRVALLEEVVQDLKPTTALIPAMNEMHPARMEAFRIAKGATSSVPRVLGYQTATTGMDFKPDLLRDVGEYMVGKMEALAAYHEAGAARLDLAPRMAQAYARYWGRFEQFSEVEAFETIRDSDG